MSLKKECHSKWHVTQNGMSLKVKCHTKGDFTQNGMSLTMQYCSKWNVIKNGMSLNLKCHPNWNVTIFFYSFSSILYIFCKILVMYKPRALTGGG